MFSLASREVRTPKRVSRGSARSAALDVLCTAIAALGERKGSFLADMVVWLAANGPDMPSEVWSPLRRLAEAELLQVMRAAARSAHSRGFVLRTRSRYRLTRLGMAYVRKIAITQLPERTRAKIRRPRSRKSSTPALPTPTEKSEPAERTSLSPELDEVCSMLQGAF
ncbi:uncharacterized protein AMSG_00906 [Thecamonas trahens ATCC 50062]|uniref:Uncharacterized protein n=1 Tax=Thecamonas trahens ATCC 50062 TaxID=461836 RepID=A0A0L0DIB4_THETB|nr:hypothetical protein AMSG_00906 [Thecamonas trahens ATCC 50062]KNC52079.1 hypothetical protein AMSG_00906 [Thecamonas trahens ATCC 50062]|eukprot:XP_013762084.1 hypothetical protein AMSG_00906 [Thecamonas trahens ATCC 50062]